MIELVFPDGGRERVYLLNRDQVVVGRSPQADLSLPDTGVSRFHARLARTDAGWTIEDLGSRNGTLVNGVAAATRSPLAPGDCVHLGSFRIDIRETVALSEDQSSSPSTKTLVRVPVDLERLLAEAEPASAPAAEPQPRLLRMATQVARTLISELDLAGLLEKVMDLVFENIPAERGVLALYEGDDLVQRLVRFRGDGPAGETIVIPTAIARRVRGERVSILTKDARAEFDTSRSVIAQDVRSAMCAPLWDGDRVVGFVYVDEGPRAASFSADDLDLLGALANYAAVAVQRQRLRDRVLAEQATRARLERYHSPRVVERILGQGGSLDSLEMHERQVTVCFTDIVGFTALAEEHDPRDVGQAINEIFAELTECIFRHDGTLDKYIGDCIMAVFGAPEPQPDHAHRGVRAALEMHETVARLNAGAGPRLQVRTGINSGRVVAGDVGSPRRKEYTVLGDAVNLASRLETQVAQPGWIVVGEATYAAVREHYEWEPLGALVLRNKRREVAAYRVLAERRAAPAR